MQLTLLHSERPKLYTILAFLSAIGLKVTSLTAYVKVSKNFTFSAFLNVIDVIGVPI